MNVSVTLAPSLKSSSSLSGVGSYSGSTHQDDVTPQMTTALTSEAEPPMMLEERLLLMSKERLFQAEHILLVIRYVIFAIALPTTICSIVVFAQREMRGATSVYVIGLSVAQLLYIITNVVGRVMHTSVENPFNSYTYIIYSVYISSYLSIVVRRASYLVMSFVSAERLYAILRPFHIRQFFLTRYPVTVTFCTYLFSATWHVYMLTKSSIKTVRSSRTGKQVYVIQHTDSYKANPDIADAFGAAAPVLMTYIPLLALMAINVATVWALRRHNVKTKRVQSSADEESREQRERQMTLTILATTVSYVVLSLPYAFHNVFKNAGLGYNKRQKYENLYLVLRSLAFTLTLLSCAIDFVCFFVLSSSFRKTFFRLLGVGAKRGQHAGGPQSSVNLTVATDVETRSR